MGIGGYLQTINNTSYRWRRLHKYDYTYQILAFNIPDYIEPGKTDKTYVEWDYGILNNSHDDEAKAVYILDGTQHRVRIHGTFNNNGPLFTVYLENFPTPGFNGDWDRKIGWKQNGTVTFALAGTEGGFAAFNPADGFTGGDGGKVVATPVYISRIYVVNQDDGTENEENDRLRDIDGGDANLNAGVNDKGGFEGYHSYLYVKYTLQADEAITGISVATEEVQRDDSDEDGVVNISSGMDDDYCRYVDFSSSSDDSQTICRAALWRSKDRKTIDDVKGKGYSGMSTDINVGRGGDYLYIIWKNGSG